MTGASFAAISGMTVFDVGEGTLGFTPRMARCGVECATPWVCPLAWPLAPLAWPLVYPLE